MDWVFVHQAGPGYPHPVCSLIALSLNIKGGISALLNRQNVPEMVWHLGTVGTTQKKRGLQIPIPVPAVFWKRQNEINMSELFIKKSFPYSE